MRVHLKGEGGPIPTVALPDPNVDTNFPPQLFLYEEDAEFRKVDFVALGYTHYEAICVGAAGGKGGPAGRQVQYFYTDVQQQMPGDIWNLHLERVRVEDYFTANFEWDHVYSWSHPSQPDKWGWTAVEMEIALNPGRTERIRTFTGAVLMEKAPLATTSYITNQGGGGGGGGLHIVSGALIDLPDEVLIVIGDVGTDAPLGQNVVNGLWTPMPEPLDHVYDYVDEQGNPESGPTLRLHELYNFFNARRNKYPAPVSFNVPQQGGHGGASKFGDIAKASGGEGGGPSVTWPGGAIAHTAHGGAGGAGNREIPGGGAAGSTGASPGADGTWDATVGKGGGGGIGGSTITLGGPIVTSASHGGRGSYSFADPSVHGPRQTRLGIIPGGGGGATLEGRGHYGSKAPKAKPSGAVYLRLIKVDS